MSTRAPLTRWADTRLDLVAPDGSVVPHQFRLRFRLPTSEEIDALGSTQADVVRTFGTRTPMITKLEFARQLLKLATIGWCHVKNHDGDEVRFTPELFAWLLEHGAFAAHVPTLIADFQRAVGREFSRDIAKAIARNQLAAIGINAARAGSAAASAIAAARR